MQQIYNVICLSSAVGSLQFVVAAAAHFLIAWQQKGKAVENHWRKSRQKRRTSKARMGMEMEMEMRLGMKMKTVSHITQENSTQPVSTQLNSSQFSSTRVKSSGQGPRTED